MRRRPLLILSLLLSLSLALALIAPGTGSVRAAGRALRARIPALTALPALPVGSPTVAAAPAPTATITAAITSAPPLARISTDPLTGPAPAPFIVPALTAISGTVPQHATEVEPAAYSAGDTIVAAFQVGRLYDGGSAAIGWATYRGGLWRHGLLPRMTRAQAPPGPFDRLSDAAVAYDARHRVWLISALAVTDDRRGRVGSGAVVVSRSGDGLTWSAPYTVAAPPSGGANGASGFYDKDWIACDDTPASPYDGHCYAQWDASGKHDLLLMSTSLDGGKTWGPPLTPAGRPYGLGGQPVVRPDGTVVVPALGERGSIIAYSSRDGGNTWGPAVIVAPRHDHDVAGHLRTEPLPSAAVDGAGRVYVAWQDCRFEARCAANDIVLSSSPDGTRWSPATRVPIDLVGGGADHFIPGLGVDRATAGARAHLALAYYYYPAALCTPATCRLYAGVIMSSDGGATWGAPRRLAGPMPLDWLPRTSLGAMVGDYIATVFSHGDAVPVLAVAGPPTPNRPGASRKLDEAINAARTPSDAPPPPARR